MSVHFSVREAINTGEPEGNQVESTTDVPCHLWMRWSYRNPRIHKKPVLRRGMWLNDDVRFCFDVFQDVEQEEEGDTLVHTFYLSPCETGRHFWYYFWGYIGGVLSPSTSVIMEYHKGIQCPDILYLTAIAQSNNRTVGDLHALWPNIHDAPAATVHNIHGFPWLYVNVQTALTARYMIYRGYLAFDTSVIPAGSVIMLAKLFLWVVDRSTTSHAVYTHIIATQGVQDDPVFPSNFGDQLPYTTNGGQVDIDVCTPGFFCDILLNASGMSWIIPEGVSRFCIRQEMDVINLPPPLGNNNLVFRSAQAAAVFRPRLIIQYKPPT